MPASPVKVEIPAGVTAPARLERNLGIDAARIIAAFATVWIHSKQSELMSQWQDLGRFAVPFFSVTAAILLVETARLNPSRSIADYTRTRFMRLYLPFLAWTGIYLAARFAKKAVAPGGEPIVLDASLLLAGSSYHTWFLSSVFLWAIISFPIVREIITRQALARAIGWVCLAAAVVLSARQDYTWISTPGQPMDYWVGQNLLRIPCFLLGLWIGLAFGPIRGLRRPVSLASLTAGALATLACLVEVSVHGRNAALEAIAGLGWFIAALGPWPQRIVVPLARLGHLSYGVFLSHVLVVEACHTAGAMLDVPQAWWWDLTVFGVACGGSVAIALALRSSKYTRWMVPG